MNPLETYLAEMRDIRAAGAAVAETSYYPALASLFNELGRSLKPKVRFNSILADTGAGLPDAGLFTPDQFQRTTDDKPKAGQKPSRGVLEIKGPADNVDAIAGGEQVARYVKHYGLALVTNYRDFLLVGRDQQGNPAPLEGFTLADSEVAFWRLAAHPRKAAGSLGQRFTEYLVRVMLTNAPLADPKDVAWFLASYARDAKSRVEAAGELPALATVRAALEEALGMKFTGEHGEHFFRSTLVQTIFYGVFSAWVLWHRERPTRTDAFDWRLAEWSLRVPFIRALYDEVATPSKLGPLGLVEVLDWTAAALNRVRRRDFFQQFQDEHAVQYFYEPFLEAFDPELRKDLGVWYTPPEIVQYQVARVDTVLREELGLADGLADKNVVVLDPCCGTAAYLVEVLRKIAETLRAKGGDALIASDLKRAAMTRVFGFEILPAPFVVSHLQLGLMLANLGAPLNAAGNERVGVYLTNALTGWEPPKEPKNLLFPELQAERDAAERVKRDKKILVILGNPPYNAFAGVSPEEEQGLVEPYKVGLNKPASDGGWGIRKFNLDDLYIRFFRLAERRIAEMTGRGVVSFISSFSYLSDPSFVVMRQRFLAEFDKLWFDCMNGDSRETGKLTPEGKPDPSVFSTDYNREGIRVGTAVCVIVRKQRRLPPPPPGEGRGAGNSATVRFRQFWGVTKRQDLLTSLSDADTDGAYTLANPSADNRHSFRPEDVSAAYNAWPRTSELGTDHFNGPYDARNGALYDIDESRLSHCMQAYFDSRVSHDEIRATRPDLMTPKTGYDPEKVREHLIMTGDFVQASIHKLQFKPFDVRFYYCELRSSLCCRPSPDLMAHVFPGNWYFVTRSHAVAEPEGAPMSLTSTIVERDQLRGHARLFPARMLTVQDRTEQRTMFHAIPTANLSPAARAYLARLGIADPDADADTAGLIWMHALAIGYSPAYLTENGDGIRRDWPRIPLPADRKVLEASADLGRAVAALLDTEAEVRGVTAGKVEPIFRTIGVLTKVSGTGILPVAGHGQDGHATQLNVDAGELAATAGWGHAGKGGVTMPGKGLAKVRPYDKAELDAIADAAKARGLSAEATLALLGPDTRDIYLNENAYWRNVPANVWGYYIGGYQVIKKWLSYRERDLLGRPLRSEEAREVMNMARRLAAIVLMQPALDSNYGQAAANAYAWPGADDAEPDAQ